MSQQQNFISSSERAAECLRLTLRKLGELNLPASAENYALFYVYHSGRSEELNKRVDELLASGECFTTPLVKDLVSKYVCECEGIDLEALNQELLQTVAQVLGAIVDFAGQAVLSNSWLEAHLERMSKTNDPAIVLRETAGIVAHTRNFINSTQVIEDSMRETTVQIEVLQGELLQARQEANIDALTGLQNRRGLDKQLNAALKAAKEQKDPLSILMIDIDHFKTINDSHGHLLGDKVLVSISKLLSNQVRGDDSVARYGGEEFVIVLQQTPISAAFTVAEKIRSAIESVKLKQVKTGKALEKITVSLGVATFRYGESMEDLLNRCDEALYRAKRLGRNRSLIAD